MTKPRIGQSGNWDRERADRLQEDVERMQKDVERLERWKVEACEVMNGLQELGKALGLRPGVQITGPAALAEVARLTAERDALAESWNPSVEDDRRWPYPAAQTVAELVVDAVLDKVFQHATEGVRRHALDVARKAVSSDGSRRGWTSDVATARVLAERDALAAQVARVEEVLDHWRTVDEGNAAYAERIGERSRFADGLASRADMLRAALAGSEADTGEQEAGHRCEPYYSRSQCGQCGWQEQWCATCSRQMCGCATETTDQEDQP